MLVLEYQDGPIKRYNNGRGYTLTVDSSRPRKQYNITYSTGDREKLKQGVLTEEQYELRQMLPNIEIMNSFEDGDVQFKIISTAKIEENDPHEAVNTAKKILHAYQVAEKTVVQFDTLIKTGRL
mgnify:CR=1 FL=1